MPHDNVTQNMRDAKKEIGKDRPKRKAIDNPLFTPTVRGGTEAAPSKQGAASSEGRPARVKETAPAREVPSRPSTKGQAKGSQAQAPLANTPARRPAESRDEAARAPAPSQDEKTRDLARQNAVLLARIKQLELERARSQHEDAGHSGDRRVGAGESRGVIQIVASLERQLNSAFELRDALEADLQTTRAKLSEETANRRDLEERFVLLEAEAALVDPLRDELSFIEEERNEIARKLKTAEDLLERVTTERDTLTKKMDAAETDIEEFERIKVDLEAQVLNLEEHAQELKLARTELEERNAQIADLTVRLRGVTGQLEAGETSKKALELDLATNKKISGELREEVQALTQKANSLETDLSDLRGQLEEQQVENADLRVQSTRLEHDLKSQKAKSAATDAEFQATQNALREIQNAAFRTEKRVQKRYLDATGKTDGEE